MFPELIDIGSLLGCRPMVIHTYGVLMALGFLAAFMLADRKARVSGLPLDKMNNLYIVVIISSIAVARLVYVATEWQAYSHAPWRILYVWRGGLVFYGGLIGGILGGTIFVWRAGLPWLEIADYAGPSITIGHILGRLGCFCYGCCYGRPTTLPWGVRFPTADPSVARHPTQLYELAGLLLIFAFLTWLYWRPHRPGMVLALYLLLYGSLRFVIEFFRGDPRGGTYLLGLSLSQNVAILAVISALSWMPFLWKTARKDVV